VGNKVSEVIIYNIVGDKVLTKKIYTDGKIDTGVLKNGLYIMALIGDGKVQYVGKIIKSKQ